jgi:hypothetical protein
LIFKLSLTCQLALDLRFQLPIFVLLVSNLSVYLRKMGFRSDKPGDQAQNQTTPGTIRTANRASHSDPLQHFIPNVLATLPPARLRRRRKGIRRLSRRRR